LANPLGVSQTQRERLAFFTGELRRDDIEARFDIKPAAVSRDLSLYRAIALSNLNYDQASRYYRPNSNFKPIHEFHPKRVLAWLLQGFGDGLDLGLRQAAPCEGHGQLVKPDIAVLETIARSICARKALRVNYLSLSSGTKKREIVPVALADNGPRWHVRSFDRERQRFSDFVMTRIANAAEIDREVSERELLTADEQWARMVDIEIVPHPGIQWPNAVVADYGVEGEVLKIKTRAALAAYVLRRWFMDSSGHHLWLRNPQSRYAVESAALAPGLAQTALAQVARGL
jgi:WYL domain